MNKEITMYDLITQKRNNEIMPKRISIMWLDYEVEYYLEENFWYRENLPCGKMLEIKPNQLNMKITILDEENDEFEDIDELNPGDGYAYNMSSKEYKINQLIRNQKKIIERLSDKNATKKI